MIKIIIKFYAFFLVLFVSSVASSGTTFEINCCDQPIRQIKYRSGAWLDYLELYTDDNILIGSAGNRTTTAKETTIQLDKEEKLIGISVKIGSVVDALTFFTDKKEHRINIEFTGPFRLFSREKFHLPKENQEISSFSGMTTTLWGYHIISEIKIKFKNKYILFPPFPLGKFLIPEKIIKGRDGVETCFIADFNLDQGNLGTCTGYAVVSSLMYQSGSSELNPESIYIGNENVEGLSIEEAMQRIQTNGVKLNTFSKKISKIFTGCLKNIFL